MISATQFHELLMQLKQWHFLGYIDTLPDGARVCRLRCLDEDVRRVLKCDVVQDYVVSVGVDGRLRLWDVREKCFVLLA